MMIAKLGDQFVEATSRHARAECEVCGLEVISVIGCTGTDGVRRKRSPINHWRHTIDASKKCDSWSEIGDWHLAWQHFVRPELRIGTPRYVERTIIRDGITHRADVIGDNDTIIEFQHSPISHDEIRERETFYGKMLWVFDGTPFKGIKVRDPENPSILHWSYPRSFVSSATKPIYIDFSGSFDDTFATLPGNVFQVRKFENNSIHGRWLTVEEFLWKTMRTVISAVDREKGAADRRTRILNLLDDKIERQQEAVRIDHARKHAPLDRRAKSLGFENYDHLYNLRAKYDQEVDAVETGSNSRLYNDVNIIERAIDASRIRWVTSTGNKRRVHHYTAYKAFGDMRTWLRSKPRRALTDKQRRWAFEYILFAKNTCRISILDAAYKPADGRHGIEIQYSLVDIGWVGTAQLPVTLDEGYRIKNVADALNKPLPTIVSRNSLAEWAADIREIDTVIRLPMNKTENLWADNWYEYPCKAT